MAQKLEDVKYPYKGIDIYAYCTIKKALTVAEVCSKLR
jgi:hypothetical protein